MLLSLDSYLALVKTFVGCLACPLTRVSPQQTPGLPRCPPADAWLTPVSSGGRLAYPGVPRRTPGLPRCPPARLAYPGVPRRTPGLPRCPPADAWLTRVSLGEETPARRRVGDTGVSQASAGGHPGKPGVRRGKPGVRRKPGKPGVRRGTPG